MRGLGVTEATGTILTGVEHVLVRDLVQLVLQTLRPFGVLLNYGVILLHEVLYEGQLLVLLEVPPCQKAARI